MNFTREPIIQTIISAREGNKLKLISTNINTTKEYLVYAVEVVSYGKTFFYRSNEAGNVFFVPMNNYEIQEVRQARMILKTPEEKAIKIAGGSNATTKTSDKSKKASKSASAKKEDTANKKSKKIEKKNDQKVEKDSEEKKKKTTTEVKKETTAPAEGQNLIDNMEKTEVVSEKKSEVKEIKENTNKKEKKSKPKTKSTKKTATTPAKNDQDVNKEKVSLFSHLLRPPEGLISDNLSKYSKEQEENTRGHQQTNPDQTQSNDENILLPNKLISPDHDDPSLISEPPKPFESLDENEPDKLEPLSLKERMKKVLSPVKKNSDDNYLQKISTLSKNHIKWYHFYHVVTIS